MGKTMGAKRHAKSPVSKLVTNTTIRKFAHLAGVVGSSKSCKRVTEAFVAERLHYYLKTIVVAVKMDGMCTVKPRHVAEGFKARGVRACVSQ